jgi:hypothetical protein
MCERRQPQDELLHPADRERGEIVSLSSAFPEPNPFAEVYSFQVRWERYGLNEIEAPHPNY